jgi:acetate kinase
MDILVINVGSSSVKLGVFDKQATQQLFNITLETKNCLEKSIHQIPSLLNNHGFSDFAMVGHRIAHGGSFFRTPCVISPSVESAIEQCSPLAPSHNPYNLLGIRLAQHQWPQATHIAVFDTAFHQTIPDYASTYAVPKAWRDLGVRRYGFHGMSHQYVMQQATKELGIPASKLNIISCHLGNGASICAMKEGISIDTSMGMTALEGLIMGTRPGDVDPGLFAFLAREVNLSPEQIDHTLYHESGLKALSGISHDMREIEAQAQTGDQNAQLAIESYCYRVRKYIGAYVAAMDGVDILAFTGGVGENSSLIRHKTCATLKFCDARLDLNKNQTCQVDAEKVTQIHASSSKIKIMVIKCQEEKVIAREVAKFQPSDS